MRHACWRATVFGLGFALLALLSTAARAETDANSPSMSAPASQPTPPPPILPAQDPEPDGEPVRFRAAVANVHPRLLLSEKRLAQLKLFYDQPQAKFYREKIEGYLEHCTVPADRKLTPAWGMEYGVIKLPTVALHYKLTGDKASFLKAQAYLKWLAGTANWTTGGEPAVQDTPEAYAQVLEKLKNFGPEGERNSDTTASFTMVGAALTWDWLYNDLDPDFRETFRQVLWQHARAMYYGGHKGGNPGGSYWRATGPLYNHRWFRDWGLALATLGAAEGRPEEQWLLREVQNELQFIAQWLPADGVQHEGPGYGASAGALGLAFEVSDDLIGTRHLESAYYRNVSPCALALSAPGMTEAMYFADCFNKTRSFHPFFLRTASLHKQADVLDGLRRAQQVNSKGWGVAENAWLSLLCDDPSVQSGQYSNLPTTTFLPDLGILLLRDSWRDNAVAARFKCGPMGGYRQNAWRAANRLPDGNLPYLNVAHDHPDANAFTIFGDGEYLAETDRYPLKPGKLSSSHNTILINGIGQNVQGRLEGDAWQQPGSGDMSEMARVTAYKNAGDVVVIEGEAAGSYLTYNDTKTKKSRPALERFRRTFIWVKQGYVLIFDDVRAPIPVQITWLMQGAKLELVNEAQNRYRLSKGNARCEFQLVADALMQSTLGISTANDKEKLKNWQQLQASIDNNTARLACVIDPWHKNVNVSLVTDGPNGATITVTGEGIHDTWTWAAAQGKFEPATWHGVRPGGFDVTVDASSQP